MLRAIVIMQLLLLCATWPIAVLTLMGAWDHILTLEAKRFLWLDMPLFMGVVFAWCMVSVIRNEYRRARGRQC